MVTTRRRFVEAGLLGGVAAALPPSAHALDPTPGKPNPRYAKLDEVLRQPVLKRELFPTPVVIESLELLRYDDSFLCRVRSRDGAVGLSVGHGGLNVLYPLFVHNLQPFFIGKDARDLDLLLEKVFVYGFNFRYGGIAIGTPARHDRARHPRPAGTHRRQAVRPSWSATSTTRRSPSTRPRSTARSRSRSPWSSSGATSPSTTPAPSRSRSAG